jgi:hypothetical protein
MTVDHNVGIYLWIRSSVPLICMFVLMPLPRFLDSVALSKLEAQLSSKRIDDDGLLSYRLPF